MMKRKSMRYIKTLSTEHRLLGYYDWESNTIMVDYSSGSLTAFLTSFHEFLHWAMHRLSTPDQSRLIGSFNPLSWALIERDGKWFLPLSKLEPDPY